MEAVLFSSCHKCNPDKWEPISDTETPYKCLKCKNPNKKVDKILRIIK